VLVGLILHDREKQPKIASFYLNAECCFANATHIRIIIISVSAEQESAVCTKQNLRRKHSMLPAVTTHSSFTKPVMMPVAVPKVELFFVEPQVKS